MARHSAKLMRGRMRREGNSRITWFSSGRSDGLRPWRHHHFHPMAGTKRYQKLRLESFRIESSRIVPKLPVAVEHPRSDQHRGALGHVPPCEGVIGERLARD